MVKLKASFWLSWLSELSSLDIGQKATHFWEVSFSQKGILLEMKKYIVQNLLDSVVKYIECSFRG
jgi:hypothetical protein